MPLRKCVSMAMFDDPGSVTDPNDRTYHGTAYSDLRYPGVEGFFTETRTRWVRFFVEYEYWFPDTGNPEQDFISYLNQRVATDFNIIRARQLGLRVILCLRHFSKVVNGSHDFTQFPPDAVLMPNTAYSEFMFELMSRYHPVNRFIAPLRGAPHGSITDLHYRWIDFFEVVNEPNAELQLAPTDPDQSRAKKTALMFSTCYGIAKMLNATYRGPDPTNLLPLTGSRPLRLMGPATADFESLNPYAFTRELLTALTAEEKANRFHLKNNIFAWSHHNYEDVSRGMPLRGSSAQRIRGILEGIWGGYLSSLTDPHIFLTEGGSHRPNGMIPSRQHDDTQNRDLEQSIMRLKNDRGAGGPGAGIEMFTNFLFYSAPQYDSGLCRPSLSKPPPPPSFASFKRPAYAVWRDHF